MIDSSVNIRGLKRFAVDHARADQVEVPKCAEATGKKIAIIGAGPNGLTAAYFLQLMGHQTVVFEEKRATGRNASLRNTELSFSKRTFTGRY